MYRSETSLAGAVFARLGTACLLMMMAACGEGDGADGGGDAVGADHDSDTGARDARDGETISADARPVDAGATDSIADGALDVRDAPVLVPGVSVTPSSGLKTTEGGGTATFLIVLTSPPAFPVIISVLSSNTDEAIVSPISVAFTASDWDVPQLVTVTGVDDSVVDGDRPYKIVTGPAVSNDMNYARWDPPDVAATNADDDQAGFTIRPLVGLMTTETAGAATFTIQLTSQPRYDVTIAFKSGNTAEATVSPATITFTSGSWNAPRTVTVTGVDDNVIDGTTEYVIVIGAATSMDIDYDGLDPPDVLAGNKDDDKAGFVISPTEELSTTENGGIAVFAIKLMSRPTANVAFDLASSNAAEGTVLPTKLTFTPTGWNTPQTVTVKGVSDSVVDGPKKYSIITSVTSSADLAYNALNPPDLAVVNLDSNSIGFSVSPASGLTTTEAGGTATFTITMNSPPSANVTFDLTSSDTTEGTVTPASLTFTPVNWAIPQAVIATGVGDGAVDGDQTYSIVTGTATSGDATYNGSNPPDIPLMNIDENSVGFSITPTSGLTTTEAGGTSTFTIKLSSKPSANVIIGLTSSVAAEGTVSPASVTFSPATWNTAQVVTLTGVDDNAVDGNKAYTIITAAATSADAAYSGLNPVDVSAGNSDNDTAGFTVTPTSGLTTTETGGTTTFTIRLSSQPTADVSLGLTSSHTSEGTVSPASLTFTTTNWSTPQTVTLTGVNDVVADGDRAYAIVTAAATSTDVNYSGLNPPDVAASNTDDDIAGFAVSPTSGLVTTEAGGTATFTIRLILAPTADVTIGLSSSNTAEGTVAPTSITFTSMNWSTPQTITITGVNDAIVDGNKPYTIFTADATSVDPNYSARNPSDVTVTNTDND